jgi:hypothetical protein
MTFNSRESVLGPGVDELRHPRMQRLAVIIIIVVTCEEWRENAKDGEVASAK